MSSAAHIPRSFRRDALVDRVLGYRGEQVLSFIRERIEEEGVAPSYGEIAQELGISSRAHVHVIIGRLERRGLIERVGTGEIRHHQRLSYRFADNG